MLSQLKCFYSPPLIHKTPQVLHQVLNHPWLDYEKRLLVLEEIAKAKRQAERIKQLRVLEKAKMKAKRKERRRLLRHLCRMSRELGVRGVRPDDNDDLAWRDPTPESELEYPGPRSDFYEESYI